MDIKNYKSNTIYFLFVFSIVFFFYNGFIIPFFTNMDDFGVYYETSKKIINHDYTIYNVKIHTDVFNYPPVYSIIIKPIGYFNYFFIKNIWLILSITLYILSSIILFKLLDIKFKENILFFISLSFIFKPALETFKWGQVNSIVLFLIICGLFFYLQERDIVSGILFGFAAAVKLSPAIFILLFLVKKKYTIVATFILTFILLNLWAVMILGFDTSINYYLKLLPELFKRGMFDNPYNQSFHNLFSRLFKEGNGYSTPVFVSNKLADILTKVSTTIILILSIITLIIKRDSEFILLFSLLLITSLISSNLLWEHHFIMIIASYIIILNKINNSYSDKIFLLIIFFLSYIFMSMNIGYDNKILMNGLLNIFVSIKLYSALVLWIINLYIIYNCKNRI